MIFFCFIKDNMANVLTGVITKSGMPELALARSTVYENLGGLTVYPLGSTTALTIDGETVSQWSAWKVGDVLKLRLRYQRAAGKTVRAGGTNGQYLLELPSIVNIDTKRVTVSTDATVVPVAITSAIIGSGYIMMAAGTAAAVCQAVLYDADAKTFRLLCNRVDDDGVQHAFQSSTQEELFGWRYIDSEGADGSTALSFSIDFSIPVTD
jgi:hypothetical protein